MLRADHHIALLLVMLQVYVVIGAHDDISDDDVIMCSCHTRSPLVMLQVYVVIGAHDDVIKRSWL